MEEEAPVYSTMVTTEEGLDEADEAAADKAEAWARLRERLGMSEHDAQQYEGSARTGGVSIGAVNDVRLYNPTMQRF